MSVVWGLEAQTDMQKRLTDANLGFLRMDIVNPMCGAEAWGYYNNRPLNQTKVEEMRDIFNTMGVLCCQQDKVIYLPMDPTWYEGETVPDIAGKYVYQLPELKLSEAGLAALAAGFFHPCNGNHRRAALVLYFNDLLAAQAELKAAVEAATGDELRVKEEELRVMSIRVRDAPFWAIQVFDIGA